jgi:RNA polymerase sigma-70 factor (ECF subfamily)
MITGPGGQPSMNTDSNKGPEPRMDAQVAALTNPPKEAGWERSDGALVARARQRDMDAFEALCERYRGPVHRFVCRMTANREDAEEITQECFVRAFENLERFREECRLSTWLMRIAVNLCTDRARMKARRTALERQEAGSGLLWMTGTAHEDPVENLEAERRAAAVMRALNALPAHHRTMIILRDFEERDYDEISEILGCTYGGAKLRVLRARRALRDRLRPLLEGGD